RRDLVARRPAHGDGAALHSGNQRRRQAHPADRRRTSALCTGAHPKPGETRGNLAAGGTGIAQPLSDHDRAVAEAIGPTLAQRRLLLVGLDMIGDYITEINVTSPTCFR